MSASSSPIVVANVGEINRGRSGSKDEDIIVAQFAVEKKVLIEASYHRTNNDYIAQLIVVPRSL
ncbi:MAG: hypothetical protein CMQ32_00485 [Gammaproteobacteria bacterium]|jgi:hypothetical protein|nr:hypothetical protein [Gammaproteobacteria bacterium]MBE46293.1 hypothetical protein [Gammaproteobacteria bacterium]